MTEAWTIGRVAKWAADDFRARGIENPRLEADLLLAFALAVDRLRIIIEQDRELSPAELARFRDLIKRRRAGEPVAYLRGEREFFGHRFRVDRRVLVPRPDTEVLVEEGMERTRDVALAGRVLDLCTGSGCVAVSIALARRSARVDAVDASEDALGVARENALRLGAYNVRFLAGDLFAPVSKERGAYHLITANPPYIPDDDVERLSPDIRDFEPRLALAGGPDGLSLVRRIIESARAYLRPLGVLAIEIGAEQSPAVRALFEQAGFVDCRVRKDYGGHDRVLSAIAPA